MREQAKKPAHFKAMLALQEICDANGANAASEPANLRTRHSLLVCAAQGQREFLWQIVEGLELLGDQLGEEVDPSDTTIT